MQAHSLQTILHERLSFNETTWQCLRTQQKKEFVIKPI
jgi:hypothetical protein